MKQLRVQWVDARSEDGWTEDSELDMRPAIITTLGHFVREDIAVLCIASSRDARTGQLSGIMFIPKVCILSREDVA